jgi:hypothetical protein
MTGEERDSVYIRREGDCVEGVRGIRLSFPGSSVRRFAPPKDDGSGRAKSRSNRREEATLRTGHVRLCTLPVLGGLTTIAPQFIPPMTEEGRSVFLRKVT